MKTKRVLQSGNRVRNALTTKKGEVYAILLEVKYVKEPWEVAHRVRIGTNPGECPTKEEALRSCQEMCSYYQKDPLYLTRIIERSERIVAQG